VAGKYRIEVSNFAQIFLNLHFFLFGDFEGGIEVLLGRDKRSGNRNSLGRLHGVQLDGRELERGDTFVSSGGAIARVNKWRAGK